jgi:hypothetical protein
LPPTEPELRPTEEDPGEDPGEDPDIVDPLLMDGPEEALGAVEIALEYPLDAGAAIRYAGKPLPLPTPRFATKAGAGA